MKERRGGGTNIEWADETWNCVVGCSPVSPGCAKCYAVPTAFRNERMTEGKSGAGRERTHAAYRGLTVLRGNGVRGWSGLVRCLPERLADPLKWKKPRRVFVDSMSDMFWGTEADLEYARRHGVSDPQPVPFWFIDRAFAVMALCPQHKFLILTKRPERMREYMTRAYMPGAICDAANLQLDRSLVTVRDGELCGPPWPLPNVWLGVSAENQECLDERVPVLLQTPAAVRFLSLEPLLGPIDLRNRCPRDTDGDGNCGRVLCPICGRDRVKPNWVIVGGESGAGARPCDVGWIAAIVEQCRAAGVPCFVKQLGRRPVFFENADPGTVAQWPTGVYFDTLSGRDDDMDDGPTVAVLRDRKGGDPEEWPEGLRAREFPEVRA